MKKLLPYASKSEEIAHWTEFVQSLSPGTYLHSMFAKHAFVVGDEILSDIAIGPVADVLAEREQAKKDVVDLRNNKVRLEKEISQLTSEKTRLEVAIDRIKDSIKEMARKIQ